MGKKKSQSNNDSKSLGAHSPHALTKLEHVRAELAKVYREARSGKIETQEGTRFAHILTCLARLIQTTDLEARVEALELAAKDGK